MEKLKGMSNATYSTGTDKIFTTAYKGFDITGEGLVRYNGHYVNSYDGLTSAIYAIDKGDTDFSIALKIAEKLKERFDYVTKLDAIKFIKNDCGLRWHFKHIYEGWKLAYND